MTEPIRENTTETFEQKLARAEGVDDSFAKYIGENWQRMLMLVAVAFLGVWVFNEYKAAKSKRIGEASSRFSQIQSTFTESLNGDSAEQGMAEKGQKVIKDNIRTLNDTFNGTSYSKLTGLYNGLLLKQQGKHKEAEVELKKVSSLPSASDFSLDDLSKEMASIALSRNLLDEGREEEARKLLEGLVKSSKIVNVEALLILARLGKSDIKKIASELRTSRPEFLDIIDRELSNFGVNLKEQE